MKPLSRHCSFSLLAAIVIIFCVLGSAKAQVPFNDRFDPYRSALEQLLEYAHWLGIPHREISQAMFAGRFNPHFDDVLRAFEELPVPLGTDLNLPGHVAYYQNREWNERFGYLTLEQAYRFGQRLNIFSGFSRSVPYEQARHDRSVQKQVQELVREMSSVGYFRVHSMSDNAFNFRAHYEYLRNHIFLPVVIAKYRRTQ